MFKRRVASVVAVAAIGVIGVVGGASAQPSASYNFAQISKSCGSSYVHAVLPDGSKCLRSGEYCSHKPGYAAAYHRAGFRCNASGRLEDD